MTVFRLSVMMCVCVRVPFERWLPLAELSYPVCRVPGLGCKLSAESRQHESFSAPL